MASTTKEYNVFLSYAHQDKSWVAEFIHALQTAGIRNWFDLNAVTPGELWPEKLQEALRQSETLVVFLSPDSVKSPSVLFEVGAAVADHKRIIPVLVDDVDLRDIPALLVQRQILRAASPSEAGEQVAELIGENAHSNETN